MQLQPANKPYPPCLGIKGALASRGISVKEVAVTTGFSYNYVVRLLNGFSYSESALRKICEAIDKADSSSGL